MSAWPATGIVRSSSAAVPLVRSRTFHSRGGRRARERAPVGVNESYFAAVNIVTPLTWAGPRGLLIERRICGYGENVLLRQSEGRAVNFPPSEIYTGHTLASGRRRRRFRRLIGFFFFFFLCVQVYVSLLASIICCSLISLSALSTLA